MSALQNQITSVTRERKCVYVSEQHNSDVLTLEKNSSYYSMILIHNLKQYSAGNNRISLPFILQVGFYMCIYVVKKVQCVMKTWNIALGM